MICLYRLYLLLDYKGRQAAMQRKVELYLTDDQLLRLQFFALLLQSTVFPMARVEVVTNLIILGFMALIFHCKLDSAC